MKNYITLIFIALITFCNAQDNNSITLGAHIPEQAEKIPNGAKRLLINKLGKIITDNGISDNVKNSRFILVPNVSVLSKDITPTAPPKIALKLEVTLYVGDGVGGNLFESESIMAKGVGTNELKAYTNAISNIRTTNPKIEQLIAESKKEILSYYEEHCSEIGATANSLEAQGKTGEALFTITNIPVSTNCFKKNDQKIKTLYGKAINEDCKRKLNQASSIWAANQSLNAANEAGFLLASIDPRSNCFDDVKKLYEKIAVRVKDISDRGWEYQLKGLELEKDTIDAAREIGVAYGNNQAQNVTYNTRGWF
ncbi:MAG: hypothetical protein AB8B59_03120 [Maribacter sp.]